MITETAPTANPQKPRTHKLRNGLAISGSLLLAVLTGAGIGSAAAGGPPQTVTKTVTKTVTVPGPVKTVTVPGPVQTVPGPTVTKDVTPQSCLQALNAADKVQALSSQGFLIASEEMNAVIHGDATGLNTLITQMDDLTVQVKAAVADYRSLETQCNGTQP